MSFRIHLGYQNITKVKEKLMNANKYFCIIILFTWKLENKTFFLVSRQFPSRDFIFITNTNSQFGVKLCLKFADDLCGIAFKA